MALALYEQFAEAPNDATRFRLIIDTIERPCGSDIALPSDVRETEPRRQRSPSGAPIAHLQASIERTKAALLKWIVPLMLGQVATPAALVKLE